MAALPGLSWAVLRPTVVFSSLIGGLRRFIAPDGTVRLAFGSARVNLIDARDVAAAAAALLRNDTPIGRVTTVTGPASFTADELVDTLAAAARRPLRQRDIEPEALAEQLRAGGADPAALTHMTQMFTYFRTGSLDIVTDEVTALTGQPPRSLAAALAGPGAPAVTSLRAA